MQVENIGGVQKIRVKLPAWLLVSKSEVASGTNPTSFFTWTDNVSRKQSLLIYNYRELAEDAVSGTPSLAGAAPFSISSVDTLREIVVALAKDGVEEIHIDRVADAEFHWAKISVADFLSGMNTLYESDQPGHPEET